MKTKRARETAVEPGGSADGKAARKTTIRTRCKGQAGFEQEVTKQMTAAMPFIVAANVEQAKTGSLVHTKWLWDKMGDADAAALLAARELAREQETLGMLLLRELKKETPAG